MLNFSFSTAQFPNEMEVTEFEGKEGISCDYLFKVSFKVKNELNFNSQDLLIHEGNLTITDSHTMDYEGLITHVAEEFSDDPHYRHFCAHFQSRLALHKNNLKSDIFVHQEPTQTLSDVFERDHFLDYFQSTTSQYPIKSFTHQYKESNFQFLSRICEHWGIFYYFDRLDQNRLVLADDQNYLELDHNYLFRNTPSIKDQHLVINELNKIVSQPPAGVEVEGRNPEFSSQIINGYAGDLSDPNQTIKLSGLGIDNNEEAEFIAKVRLEQAQSEQEIYHGKGTALGLLPGFIAHIRLPNNQTLSLLITEVEHKGALSIEETGTNEAQYHCQFKAIPSDIQFRPKLQTEKPTAISSTARIYSDFDTESLAHRDELGRYKVTFDYLADPKVSHWIRKNQATAKDNHLDMPLLPNTEVQIAYLNGNPDLPYISAAIDNSESPKIPGTAETPHAATISTTGKLHLDASRSFSQSVRAPMAKSQQTNPPAGNTTQTNPTTVSDPANYELLDNYGMTISPVESLSLTNTNYNISTKSGQSYTISDTISFFLGDNQRFYLGNQYREYHAQNSQGKSVDQSNTYQFQDSFFFQDDLTQANDPNIDKGKQAGITRKIFGNRYNYHKGHISTIFKGDTEQHKQLNYGPRYIEHIPNDTTASVSSIDQGFPPEYAPTIDDYVIRTRLNQYKHFDGDTVTVQDGNTYIKRSGDTVRIQENGSSRVDINGTFREKNIVVSGHSEKKITAGSISVSLDSCSVKKTLTGNREQHIFGSDNSLTVGAKTGLTVGPTVAVEAASSTKIIGMMKFETVLGAKQEYIVGPTTKWALCPEVKKGPGNIKKEEFSLKDAKVQIEKVAADLQATRVSVTNALLTIIG